MFSVFFCCLRSLRRPVAYSRTPKVNRGDPCDASSRPLLPAARGNSPYRGLKRSTLTPVHSPVVVRLIGTTSSASQSLALFVKSPFHRLEAPRSSTLTWQRGLTSPAVILSFPLLGSLTAILFGIIDFCLEIYKIAVAITKGWELVNE